jgi:hypothetical protein
VFDELDFDEAADLLARLERLQVERDKIIFGFVAKLFESIEVQVQTAIVKAFGGGGGGNIAGDIGRNERGELDFFRTSADEEVTGRG